MNNCTAIDCTLPITYPKMQLCNRHYLRFRKHGDANYPSFRDKRSHIIRDGVAYIPVGVNAKGGYAILDNDNHTLDAHWWSLCNGYPQAKVNGITKKISQLVLPDAPLGCHVDHINGDKLDNRRINLRYTTPSQNQMNSKVSKNNKSGYKGVSPNKKRFKAEIMINRKRKHIGTYDTPKEAAIAYNQKAIELFGEYAWLNPID